MNCVDFPIILLGCLPCTGATESNSSRGRGGGGIRVLKMAFMGCQALVLTAIVFLIAVPITQTLAARDSTINDNAIPSLQSLTYFLHAILDLS